MPTVAEQLRAGREARKLSINEVAETTKIRTDHLRALEEGNYNVFVAPVYIKGFVRCYAMLLRLDVSAIMATLDEELGRTEKFREPPPLSNEKKTPLDFVMLQLSKVNWQKGSVILGGLAVVAVIVLLIWWWNSRNTTTPSPATTQPGNVPPARYNRPISDTLPLTNAPARRQ
jgi:cytoskeleton protein RodZ